MKKQILFLFLLLPFMGLARQSTNEVLKKYDRDFLFRDGDKFIRNNERISFKELHVHFNDHGLANELYTQAKKQKLTGTVFRFASLASPMGITASLSSTNRNRNLIYGLMASQLVTGYVGLNFQRRSIRTTDKAIHLRNRSLLTSE